MNSYLFTDGCATVRVNVTKHPLGKSKYFYFDENDFTKMVGETDWKGKRYDVIQGGSKSWTGTIMVKDDTWGVHGMKDSSAIEGDWAQGDRIQLKSCVESGILLLHLRKCP